MNNDDTGWEGKHGFCFYRSFLIPSKEANMVGDYVVFTGNSNPRLAKEISRNLGVELGRALVTIFSDGEPRLEIQENIRGRDVFIIQPTQQPDRNFIELLVFLDAAKRSSARRITAVMPYFGWARQDRKVDSRQPISARLAADLLIAAGAQRIITFDLHAGQIQGFFNIPVDHLYARKVFLEDIRKRFGRQEVVIVSPDAGGAARARAYAKRLSSPLAIIDKRRENPNEAEAMAVLGNVKEKLAVIIDDMADTCGTIKEGAKALKANGAREVHAYTTHAVLSGKALENITKAPITSFTVSDTIPLKPEMEACDKMRVVSIANVLSHAIINSHNGESVSSLFTDEGEETK